MIDFLLSLSTWAGCAVSIFFTAVVGLVVYIVFYKLISKYNLEGMSIAASNLFRAATVLVSLMLALSFSEVMSEMRTVRKSILIETVAISDIFSVLKLFDAERTREIRTIIVDYAQAVIDDDWPALADDKLGRRADALRKELVREVINLQPTTPTQEKIWSHLLADIDVLSDYRIVRLNSALAKTPVFVYVIIFGFLVSMACFGFNRPQSPLIVIVTLYMILVGLVLYIVLAMSDPFQGDIGVTPTPFEYLVETLQSEIR